MDAEVGTAMQSLAGDDLLLVVGGFGMQRLHPTKRVLAQIIGDSGITGTHERAPDGFLLAYGTAVEPGRRQRAFGGRCHADSAVLPRPAGRP